MDVATDAAERAYTKLFLTAEGRADPYLLYHELRELAPTAREWMLQEVRRRYPNLQ